MSEFFTLAPFGAIRLRINIYKTVGYIIGLIFAAEGKLPEVSPMQRQLVQLLRNTAALTILVALFTHASSSQAARFRIIWDPVFNPAFDSIAGYRLGWRGTAFTTVSNSCVFASTEVTFPNTCGSGTLDSYLLEFYDLDNDPSIPTASSTGSPGTDLSKVLFDNDSIIEAVEVPLPGSFIDAGVFSFGGSEWQASLRFDLPVSGSQQLGGPFLRLDELCDGCGDPGSFNSTITPTSSWSRVPVPATLPLLAIGVAALGLFRRRDRS